MSLGRCLVLLGITVAAQVGCYRTPTPGPLSGIGREFFPLRPGTFWVYEVHDFHGQVDLKRVVVRGSFYLKTQEANGMVVEESGGNTDELLFDVSWHPVAYYRRGEFLYKFSGLSYVGAELREFRIGQGEEKVLPQDPSAHPEWENDFQIFHVGQGVGYGTRTLSSAHTPNDTITVRAGKFRDCLRVETRTVSTSLPREPQGAEVIFHYTDWYAPGIGLVKSIVEVPGAPRPVTTLELVSFRPGASPQD
jgi:hypothetical protein